jgi:prevent-host-death family protein
MPLTVDIHEARANVAALLERVIRGEEVVIARDGSPVVRWTPVVPKPEGRTPGSARGEVVMAPDFEAPLSEDILRAFEL